MTTRADLAHMFKQQQEGAGPKWKTFVIEAHTNGDTLALLEDTFGAGRVEPTNDAYIHLVEHEAQLWVDHLDDRFWSVHTVGRVDQSLPLLKSAVERSRTLDWMWLPSQHLWSAWPGVVPSWLRSDFRGRRLLPAEARVLDLEVQLRGAAAPEILDLIQERFDEAISFDRIVMNLHEREYGSVQEAINRQGRFVAKGDSFEFHQAFVRGVKERYRRLVEALEGRLISWRANEVGGAEMIGSAVSVRFSRPIPDRDIFLDQLFSSREPFRLWGIPEDHGAVAEVEAVDLHVGKRVRFDIGDDWLRVYLFEGGCGNSVARLIANLQHHFDGALSLLDPELDEAVNLTLPVPA